MKSLLTITAILEGLTGLVLLIQPPFLASALLGTSLTEPGAIVVARLAGIALITLAFACWLYRNPPHSAVMAKVMMVYNSGAVVLLVHTAWVQGISGPALWPAVGLHLVLFIWALPYQLKRAG